MSILATIHTLIGLGLVLAVTRHAFEQWSAAEQAKLGGHRQ